MLHFLCIETVDSYKLFFILKTNSFCCKILRENSFPKKKNAKKLCIGASGKSMKGKKSTDLIQAKCMNLVEKLVRFTWLK